MKIIYNYSALFQRGFVGDDSPREPMPRKVVQPPPGFSIPNSGLLNEAYCYGGNVELFG